MILLLVASLVSVKRPLIILLTLILGVWYIVTTPPQSLADISSFEKLQIADRLVAYPPITFFPVAHILEQRKEMIITRHFLSNLYETLDPNYYFFANHPRSPAGANDYVKFPWIFLPLALVGLYHQIRRTSIGLLIAFLTSVIVVSAVSFHPQLGPWLLFPFIITWIIRGTWYVFRL
jgi:hypothetical protein